MWLRFVLCFGFYMFFFLNFLWALAIPSNLAQLSASMGNYENYAWAHSLGFSVNLQNILQGNLEETQKMLKEFALLAADNPKKAWYALIFKRAAKKNTHIAGISGADRKNIESYIQSLDTAARAIVQQKAVLPLPVNIRTNRDGFSWGVMSDHSPILTSLSRLHGGDILAASLDMSKGDSVAERWLISDDAQHPSWVKYNDTLLPLFWLTEEFAEETVGAQQLHAIGRQLGTFMKRLDIGGALSWHMHPDTVEGFDILDFPSDAKLILGINKPEDKEQERALVSYVKQTLQHDRDCLPAQRRVIRRFVQQKGVEVPADFDSDFCGWIDRLLSRIHEDMPIEACVELLLVDGVNVVDLLSFGKQENGSFCDKQSLVQILSADDLAGMQKIMIPPYTLHSFIGTQKSPVKLIEFKSTYKESDSKRWLSRVLTCSLNDLLGKEARPGKVRTQQLSEAIEQLKMKKRFTNLSPSDLDAPGQDQAEQLSEGINRQSIFSDSHIHVSRMVLDQGRNAYYQRHGRHSSLFVLEGSIRVLNSQGQVLVEALGGSGSLSDEALILSHAGDIVIESIGSKPAIVYDILPPISGQAMPQLKTYTDFFSAQSLSSCKKNKASSSSSQTPLRFVFQKDQQQTNVFRYDVPVVGAEEDFRILAALLNNRIMTLGPKKITIIGPENYRNFLAYFYRNYKAVITYMEESYGCTADDIFSFRNVVSEHDQEALVVENSSAHAEKPSVTAEKADNEDYVLGVDVGGTTMKVVVINSRGVVVESASQPSFIKGETLDQFFKNLKTMIKSVIQKTPSCHGRICAMGLAWFGTRSGSKALTLTEILEELIQGKPENKKRLEQIAHELSDFFSVPVSLFMDLEAFGRYASMVNKASLKNTYCLRFGTSIGGVYFDGQGEYVHGFNLPTRMVVTLDPLAPRHASSGIAGSFQRLSASRGIEFYMKTVLEKSYGGVAFFEEKELPRLGFANTKIDRQTAGVILEKMLGSQNIPDVSVATEIVNHLAIPTYEVILELKDIYGVSTILLDGTSVQGRMGKLLMKCLNEMLKDQNIRVSSSVEVDPRFSESSSGDVGGALLAFSAGQLAYQEWLRAQQNLQDEKHGRSVLLAAA